jgi:hypothetical protein
VPKECSLVNPLPVALGLGLRLGLGLGLGLVFRVRDSVDARL